MVTMSPLQPEVGDTVAEPDVGRLRRQLPAFVVGTSVVEPPPASTVHSVLESVNVAGAAAWETVK
jgi:hypothetical protein